MATLIAVALILAVAGLTIAERFRPFIREQTVAYLENKFNCRAALASIDIRFSYRSWFDLVFRKGRGAAATVVGEKVSLGERGKTGSIPLLSMSRFRFEVDLESVSRRPVRVSGVRLEGLEIRVPPRTQRGAWSVSPEKAVPARPAARREAIPPVFIEEIVADGSRLIMLPREPSKAPLEFNIHRLRLTGAGPGVPMRYEAELTNAKPPGLIQCEGSFGPWNSKALSDTPVSGSYRFAEADLGVFKSIAGTLSSSGKFDGILQEIAVDGETRTPDFRLKSAQNPVPLETRFYAIVDGTNGNTRLQPVDARLGKTRFTVRGSVVRNAGETGRTVDMTADMPQGHLEDLLRLAVKSPEPFMRGDVNLQCRIIVPPGAKPVLDKLELDADFVLSDAEFTGSRVREAVVDMSRRAQGRPGAADIDEVPVRMQGKLRIVSGLMQFEDLWFEIPGAKVRLAGSYNLGNEAIDLHGKTWIQARVSQMARAAWKRWALKPIDPFFAREGYGTVASVKVSGTYSSPKFSRGK